MGVHRLLSLGPSIPQQLDYCRPPYSLKILPLVSYVYCLYFWFTHRFGCFRISYWSPTISLFCFISVLSGWRTLRNVYQLMGMLAWKLFDHSSVCFVWSITKNFYSPNLHCSLTLPWIFAFCACYLLQSQPSKADRRTWDLFSDRCAMACLLKYFASVITN